MPNGKAQTRDVVSVNETYTAPQNDDVVVKFTKLPDNPGVLTIQEVKLTAEQQQDLGAVSDTAYDISSTMENGSFRYNLTLPKPADAKDVSVVYAETTGDLGDAQDVTQQKQEEATAVTITGLNHFTIFVLVNDDDSGSITGAEIVGISDTFANENNPTTDFSTDVELKVQSKTAINKRAFIQFDEDLDPELDSANPGINSATVKLYVTAAPVSTRTYEIHRITSSWAEATTNWNVQPSYDPIASDSASVTSGALGTWISWDVTDDVQDIVDGTDTNNGWIIVDSTESDATGVQTKFASSNNGTAGNRPQLDVDTDTAAPAVPSLVSPADGANVQPTSLILDWSDETDPNGPVVYYYQSALSNTTGLNNALTTPIYTSGALASSEINASGSADNIYYWQVKACDSLANCSDWSGPWQVTIDGTNPTDPTDVASTDHTPSVLSNDNDIHMAWSLVGSAPGATDNLSGVDGYSYEFTLGATDVPDAIKDAEQGITGADSGVLADGIWYFHLRTVDNAGNWTSTVHAGPYVIDATAPILNSFTSSTSDDVYGPGSSINVTANYDENLLLISSLTVVLDNGQSVLLDTVVNNTISGTYTVGATGSGQDTSDLTVASITTENVFDLASNNTTSSSLPGSNIADTSDIEIDTTAPDTTIDSNPAVLINTDSATFEFSSNESPATFECQIDGGGFSSCTSPQAYAGISEGDHTFDVQATDAAGNTDPTPASYSFTVDTIEPSTVFTTTPVDPTNDSTPSFAGTSTDERSGIDKVEYKVVNDDIPTIVTDWTDAALTTAPNGGLSEDFEFTTGVLDDGNYTVSARATDLAGNVESTATYSFMVDSTAPTDPGTPSTLPNPTNSISQIWNWAASNADISGLLHYAWRVVGGDSGTVTDTSVATSLLEGIWSFFVKAVDNAGNESNEVEGTVTVDTTDPSTDLDAYTPDPTNDNTPTYTGTATDNLSGIDSVEYRVEDSSAVEVIPWTNADPVDASFDSTDEDFTFTIGSALPDGTYTFFARSTDEAGNVESTDTDTLTIDVTPPTKPVANPAGGDFLSDPTVELTSSDNLTGYTIYYTLDGTDPATSGTRQTYVSPFVIDHSLELRAVAIDGATNVSDEMSETYAIKPNIDEEQIGTTFQNGALVIMWVTDDPSTSRIVFGQESHPILGSAPNYGYGESTPTFDLSPKVTNHSISIFGLEAGQQYYYRVISAGSPEDVSQEKTIGIPDGNEQSDTSGGPGGDGEDSSGNAFNASTGQVLGATTKKPSSSSAPIGTQVALGGSTTGYGYGAGTGGSTGEVLGDITETPSPTPEATVEPAPTTTVTPQTTTEDTDQNNLWWYILAIIVIGGAIAYFWQRQKEQQG